MLAVVNDQSLDSSDGTMAPVRRLLPLAVLRIGEENRRQSSSK